MNDKILVRLTDGQQEHERRTVTLAELAVLNARARESTDGNLYWERVDTPDPIPLPVRAKEALLADRARRTSEKAAREAEAQQADAARAAKRRATFHADLVRLFGIDEADPALDVVEVDGLRFGRSARYDGIFVLTPCATCQGDMSAGRVESLLDLGDLLDKRENWPDECQGCAQKRQDAERRREQEERAASWAQEAAEREVRAARQAITDAENPTPPPPPPTPAEALLMALEAYVDSRIGALESTVEFLHESLDNQGERAERRRREERAEADREAERLRCEVSELEGRLDRAERQSRGW